MCLLAGMVQQLLVLLTETSRAIACPSKTTPAGSHTQIGSGQVPQIPAVAWEQIKGRTRPQENKFQFTAFAPWGNLSIMDSKAKQIF